MTLSLSSPQAATLELKGSIGRFSIGADAANSAGDALEVTFFLTYVGLDLTSGVNDQLLDNLMPVREVFDVNDLEFDEIMQRDIDDARVSEELIPYLLDTRTRQLVRFFPPIVVMLLPVTEDRRRPAPLYPAISQFVEEPAGQSHQTAVIQSGAPGQEVFRLEFPIMDSVPHFHDLNRLRLNPARSRLVIVDGQHRAMALLALHRNKTGAWTDERRMPYRDYYAQWTNTVLDEYDLSSVNLPVILCVLPALDEEYSGEVDLKQAARSVFLALNKNARKVSASRNRLLDDNDLIAEFLRMVLTSVKHGPEYTDGEPMLRLWAVELDQAQNRIAITSDAALTSVNHLYFLIEHLMMRWRDTSGISNRGGAFSLRTKVEELLARLNGHDLLGTNTAGATRRDSYSASTAAILSAEFERLYGGLLIRLLRSWGPGREWLVAFAELEQQVRQSEMPQLHQLMFGGQGMAAAFDEHLVNVRRRLKENDPLIGTEEAKAAVDRMAAVMNRHKALVAEARKNARTAWVAAAGISAAPSSLDKFLDETLTLVRTIAFQAAYVCTFFEGAEYVERRDDEVDALSFRTQMVEEYVASVNSLLRPSDSASLVRLVEVFAGAPLDLDTLEMPAPTRQGYRHLVVAGELQPEAWPRYRFLFLELWSTSSLELSDYIQRERRVCRGSVFVLAYRRSLRERAIDAGVSIDDAPEEMREGAFRETFTGLSRLVKLLSNEDLSEADMEAALADAYAPAEAEDQTVEEGAG